MKTWSVRSQAVDGLGRRVGVLVQLPRDLLHETQTAFHLGGYGRGNVGAEIVRHKEANLC